MSIICFHSWLVVALNLASPLIVVWGKGTSSTLSTTSGLKYSLFFPLKLFGAKKDISKVSFHLRINILRMARRRPPKLVDLSG